MENLKYEIEKVRNALFIEEESDAFEKIIERLEGYEISYGVILNSNERLEKEVNELEEKLMSSKLVNELKNTINLYETTLKRIANYNFCEEDESYEVIKSLQKFAEEVIPKKEY